MGGMKGRVVFSVLLVVCLLTASIPAAEAKIFYFSTNSGYESGYQGDLYYGTYSDSVKAVKQQLKELGYYHGFTTPWFNRELEAAVKEFQKDLGLSITGKVDAETYKALFDKEFEESQPQPVPEQQTTEPNNEIKQTEETDNRHLEEGDFEKVIRREGNKLIIRYRLKTGEQNPPADQPAPTLEPAEPRPQPEPEPKPEPEQEQQQGLTAAEQQMVDLVNQERISRGLKPLEVDAQLVITARMKSRDMIDNNYFAHQSPTYGSPFDLMHSQGVGYRYAGENLAGAPTVQRAHTSLMNSPGHRANILNSNYTHIGIGIINGGPYGMMFTQHFVGR